MQSRNWPGTAPAFRATPPVAAWGGAAGAEALDFRGPPPRPRRSPGLALFAPSLAKRVCRCRNLLGLDAPAPMTPLPASVGDTLSLLGSADYVADRSLATAVHLALHLNRPLFLEGEAGVGKTEIAKVLSSALKRRLIRLQCYEGLDVASAVYEWDYARQMIEIRLAEAAEEDRSEIEGTIFSDRFLIKRPLLQALEPDLAGAPVLLIDELDRTDEPFEAYLLELLSDFQVTIPEIGTIQAE